MKTIAFEGSTICLADKYTPIKIFKEKNGCCPDKPFVLTTNECPESPQRPKGINYSCQCACGVWCTTGFATEEEAVKDYRRMTREADYREEVIFL